MATVNIVKGNPCPLSITLRRQSVEVTSEGAERVVKDFFPGSGAPVKVLLQCGAYRQQQMAVMNGNIAVVRFDETLDTGLYGIEVLCQDSDGQPCRWKRAEAVEVHDESAQAGLAEDVEFDDTPYHLGVAIFPGLVIGSGGYVKPDSGIPKEDLSEEVQASLDESSKAVKSITVNGQAAPKDTNGNVNIEVQADVDLSGYATKSYVDSEIADKATAELFELGSEGISVGVVGNRLCLVAMDSATQTTAPTITHVIQNDGTALVTITAASGATIVYSLDGGTTWNNYTQPFTISEVGTTNVSAKATVEGELPSNSVMVTITTESAGSVEISKGTDDSSVQSVAFTATASDPTATVTIAIGQQTQSGTGTATLSVAKTDDLQTITATATATKTGKIAATATQQFAVGKLPNTKLQGKSTARVTSIFLGDTEYKESETAENGMQIVNTDNGDGTYTWTLDFGQNNIQTLIYGTDGKEDLDGTRRETNIFGGIYDTLNTAVAHSILSIDKIPDCVTRLGNSALYYCTQMTWLELAGSNIAGFGTKARSRCPARFRVDNDNFPIEGTSLLEVKGSNILSFRSLKSVAMQFESSPLLEYVIMPNTTGTGANGGNCWDCPELKYISIGNPTPVSGTSPVDWVYASSITELRKWFIGKNPKLRAVVIYESNPENTHVPTTLDNGKLFADFDFSDPMTTDFRFYVPDAAVSAYKSHSMWGTLAGFIEPLSNAPTLEEVLADNN